MLALGLILLNVAWSQLRRGQVADRCAEIIAIAYVLFGLLAFVLRDYNIHFLLFVATGLLVGAFALLTKNS